MAEFGDLLLDGWAVAGQWPQREIPSEQRLTSEQVKKDQWCLKCCFHHHEELSLILAIKLQLFDDKNQTSLIVLITFLLYSVHTKLLTKSAYSMNDYRFPLLMCT